MVADKRRFHISNLCSISLSEGKRVVQQLMVKRNIPQDCYCFPEPADCSASRRIVTARLCASKPSRAAMCSTCQGRQTSNTESLG